ncbi:coA binding domain protein [Paraburkholderia xenovorans LB400]|uniref:Acyl-CoA synthetase n=1 Tax=Paraburkholderia xenovorans (strain LB400) TaxID=266265 RepID=Q13PC3_PARXL|nr:acetate--CoA ligase family protein [Paraburkholderia xenovorans]ABE34066.1 Putative acyl-CoA synthetase [Paraburkholderia xenovorans LB400]AIP37516.1 coA binding domain protein [Paraburkholderia xenovorans LB400]
MERSSLAGRGQIAQLLRPASIAIVGASEDQSKFGGRLLRMVLRHRFAGTIYPINAKRDTLFEIKAYPDFSALPAVPDMVVLAVPQPAVKPAIEAAAKMGICCGLIITSGFSDAGDAGREAENEIVGIAREHGMRLIGPNCLGLISAANRLAACSSPVLEIPELPQQPIGLVSQSGALMTTFFDRAWSHGIGFSHGISVGNQADLELADFVEFLADDPDTQVICTYIEGVKNTQRFIAAAQCARAAGKPWLAVKSGRTEAGSRAAFSHTASIAGDHAVFAAACAEQGIVLMNDIGAMMTLAASMVRYPGRKVERLAVYTPSGGGGALACDALYERGVPLATFSDATRARLDVHYTHAQTGNPIDFGARISPDAGEAARATVAALQDDAQTDGLFVPVTMAPFPWLREIVLAQPSPFADASGARGSAGKPVLFAVEAGATSEPLRGLLREHGVPYTNTMDEAVAVWAAWRRFGQQRSFETPVRPAGLPAASAAPASGIYDEERSKALFQQYGVPVNAGSVALDADEAVRCATRTGFPVVMKIVSPDIVHKSDVGGVAVGVADEPAVRDTYARLLANARRAVPEARIEGISVQAQVKGELELIIGARRDAQFGPIIVFGAGGVLVELLAQRAIASAPAGADRVLALLETLPIWKILDGYRGGRLAVDQVVDAIVRVSWLAADLGERDFELDINPLIVGKTACWAVDGRLRIA